MVQDDKKGVMEILNETDSRGIGIKVTAKYYMQIFDTASGASKQRQQQVNLQAPLQYFYSFSFTESPTKAQNYLAQLEVVDETGSRNDPFLAIESWTFPVKKNQIIARFANLADRFDFKGLQTRYVNVHSFAQMLLADANKGKAPGVSSVKIEEISLSGNMPVGEVLEHHR